jgi:two-component system OmpR family sensor kinase/two-component system sensor histidine kinase BaeS
MRPRQITWKHRPPPWWPSGEPWPPSDRRHIHDRLSFFRRLALLGAVFLVVVLTVLFAVSWFVARQVGLAGQGPIPGLFVLLAATVVLLIVFSAIRRFISSLETVMIAADQVANGDYETRVRECGPLPMRALARSFNTMTERLQNADRQRRDLMADVAHELRTPLTVLQGRLEGLLDGVYARNDEQIGQLLDETRVLSRLIDDLRTLSLSEAGVLALQKEPIDIVALARDVGLSMQAEAAGKSVDVVVTPSESIPLVEADPIRIREVLTNLVSNAVRHTAAGSGVTISINNSNARVSVRVTDAGAGLRQEEIGRIFDRFYKGPDSHGSGLGLTIAKGIITAHGGEITAASELGRGTTVTFTLPRAS